MRSERRLLVIGGSGFVGGHLIPALLRAGYRVTVLNRGRRRLADKEVDQLAADRNSREEMARASACAAEYDAIIDTSCYSAEQSRLAWQAFAAKTRHWIHLSTVAVYRETADPPSETDPIGGAAVWGRYGADKSAADYFLLSQTSPPAVTILRPPYLYGPGSDLDRETFVWGRCLRQRLIIVPGTGGTEIQFLHVADLASAFVAALALPPSANAVCNVAADERVTLAEWVRITAKAGGFDDPGIMVGNASDGYAERQYFPFADYPCRVDVTFAAARLGWRAGIDLADGLRMTYASYSTAHLLACSVPSQVEDEILARTVSLRRT